MANIIESKIIPQQEDKGRLSDLPWGIFTSVSSRKAFKNAIKKGLVKVNGALGYTGDFIIGGELIEILEDPYQKAKPQIDFKLEVLFEDDYLALVNKPAGILVSGNKKFTLENALAFNLLQSNREDALRNPEPIHRLDYATSGVLLIGKTRDAIIKLNKLFEERHINKTYHAICIGEMQGSGAMESDIENKNCKSSYQVLETLKSDKYNQLNLVQLIPHTGRRNQLRIHLLEIGNPILGDVKYGQEGLISKGSGLYLHASSLSFKHPLTNEMLIISKEPPKKFAKLFPNIL